jgi:hypothetical protein
MGEIIWLEINDENPCQMGDNPSIMQMGTKVIE